MADGSTNAQSAVLKSEKSTMFLDCTLRDGGYYNSWDFPKDLTQEYLNAINIAGVDLVELGFRSLKNEGFKGPCAYTSDSFLKRLTIPEGLSVGVMINGSELVGETPQQIVLEKLFPNLASDSPLKLVRIACHVNEFEAALNSVTWLKDRGYKVGFNLMQISEYQQQKLKDLAKLAQKHSPDVLYFADSMGSMNSVQTKNIIQTLRSEWSGPIGIHAHDNQGRALSNTTTALEEGVTWVDSTVTGMGRGAGNARTEELAIEIAERRCNKINLVPLMALIRKHFNPMKNLFGWGTNTYYYLAGKYKIHPSYVQAMLGDSRYSDDQILSVIEHLSVEGGKKFDLNTLDAARHFFTGNPNGSWDSKSLFANQEIILLGAGPGVTRHREAIEQYIRDAQPVVMALNTQTGIDNRLIDVRVACHPVRLLADCEAHCKLPQPLITPFSNLPEDVQNSLCKKEVLDFGINIETNSFKFENTCCTLPNLLVVGYALAVATSGEASRILLAGFDGYPADDPRNGELQLLLTNYQNSKKALPLVAVTSTRLRLKIQSIYSL